MRVVRSAITVALLVAASSASMSGQAQKGSIACDILWERARIASASQKAARLAEFRRSCSTDKRAQPRPAPVSKPQASPVTRKALPRPAPGKRKRYVRQPYSRAGRLRPVAPAPIEMTLEQAVDEAVPGQNVLLTHNYTLDAPLHLRRSVQLVGEPLPDGTLPAIIGQIIVEGGDVYAEKIKFQSPVSGPALEVNGGSATIVGSEISFSGVNGQSQNADLSALLVKGGFVRISGGTIGPGYGQALAVAGGTLVISGADIENPGHLAMFVFGGSVTIGESRIYGARGLFVTGKPEIDLSQNTFTTDPRYFAITFISMPAGNLLENSFRDATDGTWLCIQSDAQSAGPLGLVRNRRYGGGTFAAFVTLPDCQRRTGSPAMPLSSAERP